MKANALRTFCLILLIAGISPRSWSLDLFELFPQHSITGQGDFSTLDGYSMLTFSGRYSWMPYVNPVGAVTVPFGGDGLSTTFLIGNLMEVYKREVDCHLFPFIRLGGDQTQVGASVEISKTYRPLTPYLRFTGEDKLSPLWNIGASYLLWEGAEILFEVTPGGDQGSSIFAGGFNYRLMRDLELIADIANNSKVTMLHVGAIYLYQL